MRRGHLTPLLLTILCCLSCLLLFQNTKTNILVTIVRDRPVHKMSRIIQQQSERIDYLSSRLKLIYRCAGHEPGIKYPRHASVDLTNIVMSTNDECGNSSITDAVLIVHTSVDHFDRREQFRRKYSNYNYTKPYRLKVVFLLGSSLDADLQLKLERENMDFGDTVVGSFLDTYHNLTLKAVMGFRWLTTVCPDVKLVIKMDDDVVFDVRKFFMRYWQKIGKDRKKESVHCHVWHNAKVRRTGKWKVDIDLLSNTSYKFPYCTGMFVVITPDLMKPLYDYGRKERFFWIDDVFLYGMVPAAIRGVHFIQLGGSKRFLTQSYSELQSCRQTMGSDRCPIWAALTSNRSEFDLEYSEPSKTEALKHNKKNPFPSFTAKIPADFLMLAKPIIVSLDGGGARKMSP